MYHLLNTDNTQQQAYFPENPWQSLLDLELETFIVTLLTVQWNVMGSTLKCTQKITQASITIFIHKEWSVSVYTWHLLTTSLKSHKKWIYIKIFVVINKLMYCRVAYLYCTQWLGRVEKDDVNPLVVYFSVAGVPHYNTSMLAGCQ